MIPLQKLEYVPHFVPSGLVGSQRDLDQPGRIIRSRPAGVPAEPGLAELPLKDARQRYAALFRVKQVLKTHEAKREEILAGFTRRCRSESRPTNENRVVNADQLLKLTGRGLRVGAHSRNHPILSGLGPPEARAEVSGSRSDLEGMIGTEVLEFAYPNGPLRLQRHDSTIVAEADLGAPSTERNGNPGR